MEVVEQFLLVFLVPQAHLVLKIYFYLQHHRQLLVNNVLQAPTLHLGL